VLHERHPAAAVTALVALGAAAFCFVTSENLPVGLLQVMAHSFHASISAVGLQVSVYAVTVVVGSAPLTHLAKALPRRPLICGLLATLAAGSVGAALAPSYWWLLVARVVTALGQSVFWAVAAVTAVSLFRPEHRGRAVAGVLGGGSIAIVTGVPAGTWLGQQAGWRVAFFVLGGLGAVILVLAAVLLPSSHPGETHAGRAKAPDRRRFLAMITTTVLIVCGFDTLNTYISPFVTGVAGLPAHDVALVLFLSGGGGAIGVAATASRFEQWPRLGTLGPPGLVGASLYMLYIAGRSLLAVVFLLALLGFALGGVVVANQTRVMVVAPGNTDVASAWTSAAFNLGIAAGSLAGSLVLRTGGVRLTALAGALFATAGLAVISWDERLS